MRGCYCSRCKHLHKKKQVAYCILAGEIFTVYPKIVSIEDIQGVMKAREILNRGLEQMNTRKD